MPRTTDHSLILIFGPLNNITAQWDHRELCIALQTAFNCQDVPGPPVPHHKFHPKYITLYFNSSVVNVIVFHVIKKSTPGVFETRLPSLVKLQTGELVDDFQRALEIGRASCRERVSPYV